MRSIAARFDRLNIQAPGKLPDVKPQLTDLLTLRLETPMYGGGAKNGVTDTNYPVRISSLRGNLRYWWRMLFAKGRKGDELRKAESAIWGSTSEPSSVKIFVECAPYNTQLERDNNFYGFQKRYGTEAYALFPATNADHKLTKQGMTFTLNILYANKLSSEDIRQVRFATAAWIYFGGLGARTRRGLGTVKCEKIELNSGGRLPDLKEVLAENKDIVLWTLSANNALSAWNYALEQYRRYRQQRNDSNENGKNRGRSHWPEPDSIRMLTGQGNPRHKKPITDPIPAFPRAALGLPIIFQFVHENGLEKVTIKGKQPGKKDPAERMSSPVITKAIFYNNKWQSAVIILPRQDALNITTVHDIKNVKSKEEIIGVKDERYITIKTKYNPTQRADNAIDGFENYIKNNGFNKI